MYKNFFNLLRDSIRGNILILLYPLPGSSLVPFHVTVLGQFISDTIVDRLSSGVSLWGKVFGYAFDRGTLQTLSV